MIVVLDTQICVYNTHLLGNEIGQQLVKFLQAKGGKLFVPEILRVEYIKQTRIAVNDKQENIAANAGMVVSFLGRTIGYDTMSNEMIDKLSEERLNTLQDIIRPGPMMADLHAVTGERVVAEIPPSPGAGYKDCMIWEAILTLPPGSDVYFATRDNGFYDRQGFLQSLVAEAQTREIRLRTFNKIDLLLRQVQAEALERASAEVSQKIQNPPASEAAVAVPPSIVPAADDQAIRRNARELDAALERLRQVFEGADAKVLGFIAYLEAAGKEQIYTLLNQAGMTTDIARNSAERLAHAGTIRDTGTHYMVPDRTLAVAAAARVEAEMIGLLNEGSSDGA